MSSDIDSLLEVLEQEFEAYDRLEDMLLEERDVLRRPKIALFEEQLGLKAQVITRITRLEKERARLMMAISAEQGLDGENIKLVELLRNAPPPQAARMMDVRNRLQKKVEKVNHENGINQKFADSLLSVMNGVMDSIRSAFAEPAMYGEHGTLASSRVNGGEIVSQSI